MLLIFLIYKTVKKICRKDGILEKRREAKLQIDARKFEKLKIRFERSGAVIEREKDKHKGHAMETNKGPVKELNVGTLKQLPPFVLEP